MSVGPYSIGSTTWPGLSKLIEECGEIIQVAGKIIGSGGDPNHWDGTDLEVRFVEELGDLLAAIRYVRAHNVLDRLAIDARVDTKFLRFQTWDGQERREARSGGNALSAVTELRKALTTIPLPSPAHAPGTEPTAADACRQLLEMIEHGIRQIEVFVGALDVNPDGRVKIIGGPWPERVGLEARIVHGIGYPWDGRGKTEVVILIDHDPLMSRNFNRHGVEWSCVIDRKDLA
jgi:hypothetical protein